MKTKFFFLFILFMGFGMYTFAQSATDAVTVKKDTPKKEVTIEKSTTSQSVSKADCKWVDENKDGICDICGKKECGIKKAAASMKGCDPAACKHQSKAKSCDHAKSKDGKKED
jgi:hypothetical protein